MEAKINDLFCLKLKSLYDIEDEIIKALPKMIESVTNPELKKAFEDHLAETEIHKDRLEEVFTLVGENTGKVRSEAIRGLASDAEWLMVQEMEAEILDLSLIGAAQSVEHYEIASYNSAISLAEQIGNEEAAVLLGRNLDEEIAADEKLNDIAEDSLDLIRAEEEDEAVDEEEETPASSEEE